MEYKLVVVGAGGVGEYCNCDFFVVVRVIAHFIVICTVLVCTFWPAHLPECIT